VRRLGGWVAILTVILLLAPTPSSAQGGEVTLRLIRQSFFGTPEDPLKVRVEATNSTDDPLADLAVAVTIYPDTDSRSEYAQALTFDAPFPLVSVAEPVDGGIEAGETRALPLVELAFPTGSLSGNTLLPVKVELTSAGGQVAVLRTAVVFIVDEPQLPLNVNLTVVLDAPLRMQPDGSFVDGALAREIAPDGRLDVALAALEGPPFPMTLVVSPLLLEQVARMSRGYRLQEGTSMVAVTPEDAPAQAAADFLERLRSVAQRPDTELVALPYASPSVPALVRPQLGQDLRAQVSRGRTTLTQILGVGADEGLFRPPGGLLSAPAVQQLALAGVDTLLLEDDSVEPLLGLAFTPPPTGLLPAGPERALEAVVPEPGLAQRAAELPDDPRLRAQVLIGELAAIYFEFPGVDRGVSLVIDGARPAEPLFLSTLVRALTALPDRISWLRPATATRLLATAGTGPDTAPPRRQLVPHEGRSFSPTFLAEMAETQALLQQFAGVVGEDAPIVHQLRGLRFIAESRWLLPNEEQAQAFLEAARRAVHREFGKVQAPPPTSVTLTTQGGVIPVTIHKQTDYDMRVALVLRSPRLDVIGGPVREVTLTRPDQLFTFQVRAQTTGRFPVDVLVQTPGGAGIATSRIVVRSTAYNKVALFVMIAAALFLVAWWGRRFLPRRK
jgi:hypothetical protein